jgi:hypothetical protein
VTPPRRLGRAVALGVGMLSLVATLVSLLFGQRLAEPEPTDTDAYSEGPLGHRALVELYEELDVHVLVDREGVHEFAGAPVFFVEPAPIVFYRGEMRELDTILHERAYAGHDSVVVLPKWSLQRDGDVELAIRANKLEVEWLADEVLDHGAVELRREDIAIPETAMLREWTVPGRHGPRRVVLQERQTLRVHDPDVEVILGTDRAALIVALRPRTAKGRVLLVSDPDLLHNFNVHRGDHARIALDLLDELHTDAVVVDEVMHGHGYELTLGAVLGRFPAVLLVAHAVLLALLCAWAGMQRFGAPAVPRPPRQSTRALVQLAARALASSPRRARALTVAFVCISIEDAADRLGVPPARVLGARARALDELARHRGIDGGALSIVAEVTDVQGPKRPLLQIVVAVYRLRRRLLGLRGSR